MVYTEIEYSILKYGLSDFRMKYLKFLTTF